MFPSAPAVDALGHTLAHDLVAFAPELALCGGIVALLLARLTRTFARSHLAPVAVAAVGIALVLCAWPHPSRPPGPRFAGMIVADAFATYTRAVVLAAALLTIVLTDLTRVPGRLDSADFYVLLLGGTLGMCLMASANHLLMAFLAVEMASLPGYVLAGFGRGRRAGGEAALKYVVFGAAASGVMLYGVSLLAGTFGTGSLPALAEGLAARLRGGGFDAVTAAGLLFVLVGLAFKLAAVPFHFWCPDVFSGAAAEVAGFLSVASKAGAVALTTRFLFALQAPLAAADPYLLPRTLGVGVGIVAAVTVTWGNLAALGQTNLKRLLAYSTVAHAGTMLLAVATLRRDAASAVLFYLAAYVLMNGGAFAAVALVRDRTGREDVDAVRGLGGRSPVLAVTLTVFLLALLGLPPLAGFAGKFQVFAALVGATRDATSGGHPGLGTFYAVLLAVGAVNTAVAAYYYLKVVRAMFLDDPPDGAADVRLGPSTAAFLVMLAVALVVVGVAWNLLTAAADRAVAGMGGR